MALKPTQRWLDAARAGSAEPVLLVELRPTVLYAEKNFAGDWRGGRDNQGRLLSDPASTSGLNTAPPEGVTEPYPDELRLARAEVEHPEMQPFSRPMASGVTFRHFGQYESAGTDTYKNVGQYVQTFRCCRAFRLRRLKAGLYNSGARFKGRIRIKIYSHLCESALNEYRLTAQNQPFGSSTAPAVQGIYNGAKLVHSFEFNAARDSLSGLDPEKSLEGRDFESAGGDTFKIFDLSASNVWLPGGDAPCALDLSVDRDDDARSLHLYGSADDRAYGRGQLLHHDHGSGKFYKLPGDMGFKFMADGYVNAGSGIFTFDLGEKPHSGLQGELELRYCEPLGTSALFELRECDSGTGWPSAWRRVSDGAALGGRRFVQVRVSLSSRDGLDTPRIYSVRVAYRSAHRFVMASRPLFGYPNLVAEAPDYSAEGDPLSGRASASDTSRLVLLDAGGMLPRLFSLYNMKNDEVKVYLGFDAPGFLDNSAADYNEGLGDWLHYKSLWIEDWEIGEGVVTLYGYDQQVRFLESESPSRSPEDDRQEQIHYNLLPPALIKRDFLLRARMRPSRIDFVAGPDGLPLPETSFGALGEASAWRLSRVIEKPAGLHSEDQDLNRHLLAFQAVDERGRWVARRADFSASPVARLSGDDILEKSERFQPGHRHLKNIAAVYYGGEGNSETDYRSLCLEVDEEGGKSYKEFSVDKLLSRFIPLSADPRDPGDIPVTVARARLRLQRHGLRSLDFSTRLEYAWLQIGDHVHVDSRRYRRPGAGSPNPLLVMLTRKSIDRGLGSVSWSALVLADAQEEELPGRSPAAPLSVTVEPNNDGTVTWSWQASPDDDGDRVLRYDLFRRLAHLDNWAGSTGTVSAGGKSGYSIDDGPYDRLVSYDFGVRAVGVNGRASAITVAQDVLVTAAPPAPPSPDDWRLETREGAIAVYLLNDAGRAQFYRIHVLLGGGSGWRGAGTLARGARREPAFLYYPDDPASSFTVRAFALSAVDSYGQEGEWSAPKLQTFRRLMPSTQVLPAPAWEDGAGVYPLVNWIDTGPYHGYSISCRLGAPQGCADLVERYEVQRSDDLGTGGLSWSDWERLPDCSPSNGGAAAASGLVYENRDSSFKAGNRYRYRARAIGRNETPGLWGETLRVTLNGDSTAPDRPVLSLVEHTGHNELSISAPAISGGPCPDFSHWLIEGFRQENGQWEVLEPHWCDTSYQHSTVDEGLEKNWKYRVTAFDFSGNASPVSLETGFGKMKRAGTAFLSSTVNDTLAQVWVNEAEIGLKVSRDGVISAINLSPEAVDITGRRITLDGDTVFSADCEIYGELKLCRTSQDTERIEIGTFSSGEEIRCYGSKSMGTQEHLGIRFYTYELENNNLPVIQLKGTDVWSLGSEPQWMLTGWGLKPLNYACLGLPDAAMHGAWFFRGQTACIGWDYTLGRLLVNRNDTVRTFIPREQDYDLAEGKVYRIDGVQVVGACQAAVADAAVSGTPAQLSECARAVEFDALAGKFNQLLGRLRAHGLILS